MSLLIIVTAGKGMALEFLMTYMPAYLLGESCCWQQEAMTCNLTASNMRQQ